VTGCLPGHVPAETRELARAACENSSKAASSGTWKRRKAGVKAESGLYGCL